MKGIIPLLTLAQAVLAFRVFYRMGGLAEGKRVERCSRALNVDRVTVIVPVLNEENRLSPCLEGLVSQGPEVAEILVVDGGSSDGTPDLVRQWQSLDGRIRLIDARPVPCGANGKAHGLQKGLEASTPENHWVLTIDADIRSDPLLVRSLLDHARHEGVPALSAATLQVLSGAGEGLLHPSMLTSLVYRFGIPGHATHSVNRVQANGQCFLVRRDVLQAVRGFATLSDSVCEDVTLARAIVARGFQVGFYETDGLVSVEMYTGWRDVWDNWTRSLPMRDRFARWSSVTGLVETFVVQALPPWLIPLAYWRLGSGHPLTVINVGLACARVGVLAGTARAYVWRPWTYWLSPVCDLPVALKLWYMWHQRRHTWRGHEIISGHSS